MAYRFNFDLSTLPKNFFKEIATISKKRDIHGKVGKFARTIAKKFRISEITGIPVQDAITVVEDLIDVYVRNLAYKDKLSKARRKALLLPHCSRKYMDSRCKAKFDPEFSTYKCAHCSKDCLINKATRIGEKEGYDVYILPGGSCIRKIFEKKKYDIVVGVACCEEIKLGSKFLDDLGIPSLGVPLTKNGCSNTKFSLTTLRKVLTN